MEIYLIRHTKPLIDKDICYGQVDVPVEIYNFELAIMNIVSQLPKRIDAIYSSPLFRCSHLAKYLQQKKYRSLDIRYSNLLKEIDFGEWENKRWNDINQTHLNKWMTDFVNEPVRGGESFLQLHLRTREFIERIIDLSHSSVIIVTHAGVIRSVTSHIQQTELKDAFGINCEYGSVTKLEII